MRLGTGQIHPVVIGASPVIGRPDRRVGQRQHPRPTGVLGGQPFRRDSFNGPHPGGDRVGAHRLAHEPPQLDHPERLLRNVIEIVVEVGDRCPADRPHHALVEVGHDALAPVRQDLGDLQAAVPGGGGPPAGRPLELVAEGELVVPRDLLDVVDEVEGNVERGLIERQNRAHTVVDADARPVAVVPLNNEFGGRRARVVQRQLATRIQLELRDIRGLHAHHSNQGECVAQTESRIRPAISRGRRRG